MNIICGQTDSYQKKKIETIVFPQLPPPQVPVRPTPQSTLKVLRPRPEISDTPSASELLDMANWLIDAAQTSVQDIAEPFTGIGTILPADFKHALQLQNATVQHLQDLLEILPGIPDNTLNKSHSGYWQIMNEIYVVISDVNKLSLLLQKRSSSDRQDITKQSNSLASEIFKLKRYFQVNESSL